jgi:hypothetical protein
MMDKELGPLLDRAAERDAAYVPDVEKLLVKGRRSVRRRYAAASAGVVATVAVVVTGVSAAVGAGHGLPGPVDTLQPAGIGPTAATASASAADVRIATDCSKLSDATSLYSTTGQKVYEPKPAEVKGWRVAVSVADTSGTSAILLSPDGKFYAICSIQPAGWAGGEGDKGIDFARVGKAPVLPTSWKSGYRLIGWANDCNPKDSDSPCKHEAWGGAGRVPAGVARVTVGTRDGFTGEATIRDGYLAYQHLAPYRPMISSPPVILTMYDAAGKKLASFDQNLTPPLPPRCQGVPAC